MSIHPQILTIANCAAFGFYMTFTLVFAVTKFRGRWLTKCIDMNKFGIPSIFAALETMSLIAYCFFLVFSIYAWHRISLTDFDSQAARQELMRDIPLQYAAFLQPMGTLATMLLMVFGFHARERHRCVNAKAD